MVYNDNMYSDRFSRNPWIDPSERLVDFAVSVRNSAGTLISGALVVWSDGERGYTNSRGVGRHTSIGKSDAPQHLKCSISMDGYQTKSNIRVDQNIVTSVVLDEEITTVDYYYSFYTVDARGKYIPSVDVKIYPIGESSTPKATAVTPSSDLKYVYRDSNGGPLNFKFTKNGYKNVTSGLDSNGMVTVSPKTSIIESNNNTVTIVLEQITYATYYYAVQVKDDNNNPVSGVTFETYKDLGATDPYMYTPMHISNPDARETLLKRVKEILSSRFNVPVSSIKESDDLVKDYGMDSLDAMELIVDFENEFDISIPENEIRNGYVCNTCGYVGENVQTCPVCGGTDFKKISIDTVKDLVDYIQMVAAAYPDEQSCFVKVPIRFTNGSNGLSTINQVKTSNTPSPIYVKVVSIPNTYSSTGLGVYAVQPTLTPTTPGCTVVLHSKSGSETKYYNLVVTDKITGTPVEDANVTYVYNDEVISDQNTAANGGVRFSYAAPSLLVSIYKSGYEDYSDIPISGRNDGGYLGLQLTPKNTVRVIYTNTDGTPGEPAAGLNVEIFNYNNGKKIVTNRLTTHTNGYIDTLDISLYDLNTRRYVTVVNYDIDDKTRLTKTLTPGNLVIEIPYIDEDSDSDIDYYSFEEFADMSINNIKNFVKKGNSELKNTNYTGTSDKVSYNSNDFRIDILDPDTVSVYDIFESYPVMMYNNQKSVIGSVDIGLKSDANQLRLKMINRYSGYYNPIFKDILFYYNFETVKGVVCPYSNTAFDYNYSDNYGKFGTINNLWFHKANDNKNIEIINSLTPYFPLTGQYALDHRDYNIFSSSWDMDYYTRQTDLKNSESCRNIASMKNDLCMFGSKYLNVPNTIEICGFRLGDDKNWNGEWNDDWITNPEGCPGEMMYKEINDNSVEFYFFFTKRILRYFYENLKDEFKKYISENEFSYGKDGLEDDIKEYVSKNVLKLYRLEKVRLFVRRIKVGQHNSKIENNYTEYLEYDPDDGRFCDVGYFRRQNFNDVKTITLVKMNRDDFDRKIVYNLRTGMKEEFGFSFILTKI